MLNSSDYRYKLHMSESIIRFPDYCDEHDLELVLNSINSDRSWKISIRNHRIELSMYKNGYALSVTIKF